MSRLSQHWLAVVFVLLALACAGALVVLAAGALQIRGEWPGLLVGVLFLLLLWAALRR